MTKKFGIGTGIFNNKINRGRNQNLKKTKTMELSLGIGNVYSYFIISLTGIKIRIDKQNINGAAVKTIKNLNY